MSRKSDIYDASRTANSDIALEYAMDENALHNSKDPNLEILHEKPEHRIIITLKAQGKSNREIYAAFGGTFNSATGKPNNDGRYTESWISQIVRQPWARVAILAEIKRTTNGDSMQALLAGQVEDSIFTLVELRDNAKDDPAVRRGCANDLLDRVFGKPTQHVHSDARVHHTMMDIASLDKELAETQKELTRLTGEATPSSADVALADTVTGTNQ